MNEIDSYEFVKIKKETFLLNKFSTLPNFDWLGESAVGLDG
jgi:hypothetical protein